MYIHPHLKKKTTKNINLYTSTISQKGKGNLQTHRQAEKKAYFVV